MAVSSPLTVNGPLKDGKSGSEMFCVVPPSCDVPLIWNIEAFCLVFVIRVAFICPDTECIRLFSPIQCAMTRDTNSPIRAKRGTYHFSDRKS